VIIVQARYRYRVEPDRVQQQWLARTFGCVRVVFNDAIRCRDDAYRAGAEITPTEIQRRVITEAKTTEERAWLSEVASVALVQSVQDAHRAYRNFFDSVKASAVAARWGDPGSGPARTTGSRSGSPATASRSDRTGGCTWPRSGK